MVEMITNSYPDFTSKKDLIVKIGELLPGYVPSVSLNQDHVTRT